MTEEHSLQRITPLLQISLESKGVWTGTQIFLCWTLISAPCISNESSSLHERACSHLVRMRWIWHIFFGFSLPRSSQLNPASILKCYLDLCRFWGGMSGRIVYIKSKRKQWHWRALLFPNSLARPFSSIHYYYITEILGLRFLGKIKNGYNCRSSLQFSVSCPPG